MRFKIDWASLIVGSKFTVFALVYFVFEGNFPSTSPPGAYIWKGDLTEGFLRYRFGGLIFGGAFTWRGLFSEFYGMLQEIFVTTTLKSWRKYHSVTIQIIPLWLDFSIVLFIVKDFIKKKGKFFLLPMRGVKELI